MQKCQYNLADKTPLLPSFLPFPLLNNMCTACSYFCQDIYVTAEHFIIFRAEAVMKMLCFLVINIYPYALICKTGKKWY